MSDNTANQNTLPSGVYAILDLDRLAPSLPSDPAEELERVLAYGAAAVDSGAIALQLRAKSSSPQSLHLRRLYLALLNAFGERVPVVMNDVLDVMRSFKDLQGVGLHLGQDDLSPITARRLLGDAPLIGYSTHNMEQVSAAKDLPLSYLSFGPIRAAPDQEDAVPAVGFDGLQAAFLRSNHPLVAIGRLGHGDIAALREAGATAMAVIGAWLGPKDAPWAPKEASRAMAAMAARWKEVAAGEG